MLEPQNRAALSELLRPPLGFELSRAVGTTFTLDLQTALAIPLSFASARLDADTGNLGILAALGRTADKIDIFAQAGQVSMGTPSDLVALIETSVHPVVHTTGLFHPKVWFLEFTDGTDLRHRFVCSSRNLTADRSWDTVISLDGQPGDEALSLNAPLAGLLRALPALAVRPLPERVENIRALADRWERVTWERPEHVHDVWFHVLGLGGSHPRRDSNRTLLVSPFVSDDGLRALRSLKTPTTLVSRPQTIDRLLPTTLDDANLTTRVLSEAANPHPDTEDGKEPADRHDLNGLHAKMVIRERDHRAHVFLGSANATGAAWGGNLEVMVELEGKKWAYGVEPVLASFATLLEDYTSEGGEPEPEDEAAGRRLEARLRDLAGLRVLARLVVSDPYAMDVWCEGDHAPDDGVGVEWSLLTRPDIGGSSLPGQGQEPVRTAELPLTDVTPFLVLTARDEEGRQRTCLLLAELRDDHEDRRDAILARQLTDTDGFVRFLSLLLQLGGWSALDSTTAGSPFGGGTGATGAPAAGLFEPLVRALGARDEGLDYVDRIVRRLESDGQRDVLPPGFIGLWRSIWRAHQELTTRKERP